MSGSPADEGKAEVNAENGAGKNVAAQDEANGGTPDLEDPSDASDLDEREVDPTAVDGNGGSQLEEVATEMVVVTAGSLWAIWLTV